MSWAFDKPEHQRGFGCMPFNDKRHPMWGHTFNPYRTRAHTPNLDKRHFDALLDWENSKCHDPDVLFSGCLDAPDDLPLGGTASINTIGGYAREEYLHLGREWHSWADHVRCSDELATMLKQILEENEA